VLAPESAPPSVYTLTMLAYMPIFRHEQLQRSGAHLRLDSPSRFRVRKRCSSSERDGSQPHLIMGDVLPHRNAVEADVPFALMWLETMARLNFLRRKRRMDEAL